MGYSIAANFITTTATGVQNYFAPYVMPLPLGGTGGQGGLPGTAGSASLQAGNAGQQGYVLIEY
jgi:hypothetical protein